MSATVCLLLYGVALVWLSPRLLDPITRSGTSPRLSVALWLSAIVVAATVWVVAGAGLIVNMVAAHSHTDPLRYCMDVLLAVHRVGWVGDLVLAAVATAGVAGTVLATRRIVHTLRRFSARSCEHAHAARLLGVPSTRGVVIVPSDRRAAYCVAGRPSAIVVTSGAVSSLDEHELRAVLAHERAHLRWRHPQLMMLLNAFAVTLPSLPLVRRGTAAVGRLIEMSADDTAARRYGGDALLSGLVALAGQPRAAGPALGAGDTAVVDRALRLAEPATAAVRWRHRLFLSVTMLTVVVAPAVVLVLSHS